MQVFLTPSHLAIVMEYAAGGELFDRICNAGKFSEDEVRVTLSTWFFHSSASWFLTAISCIWILISKINNATYSTLLFVCQLHIQDPIPHKPTKYKYNRLT